MYTAHMDLFSTFLTSLPDFINDYGYYGIFAIVFIESSTVLGAFLPGDSFLFLTGVVAAKGILDIVPVCATIFFAAVLGNEAGYTLGKMYGWTAVSLVSKKFSTPQYHKKAHDFYMSYGFYSTIIARFVPVMRSLMPIIAGMAEMPRMQYFYANVCGALVWAVSVPMVGYVFGNHMSSNMALILPLVGFSVFGFISPIALYWWHGYKQGRKKA
jgi:membrane-associated protein